MADFLVSLDHVVAGPREREVLALMAEGRTNGSIAAAHFVSEAAVRTYPRG